ncbi:hypothetical protein E0Z10_g7385 [Xylaria hypoxylon]|uniref:Stress-response A/B barrel domain-containing protein n=1 Tax=Xylaria hypoxylon TaxID=37992 RepID=A0A4Z0YPM3_9PEZI|nr:hypothetical protein E0Z10_g7385 [Xylaria hypoxylon]
MPVNHVALFKLRPDVSQSALAQWTAIGHAMVGKIPGLIKIDTNTPLPGTEARAQGYGLGAVAVFEKPEDLQVFATHPAHMELLKAGKDICAAPPLVYEFESPA